MALRALGYIEGQNIATEYRYAEGKVDRYPELAADLVRLKVDVIVVAGGSDRAIRVANNATKTIPIVMSISAGCIFHPRKPSPGSRIFMAIGEKDQISGVEPCQKLAAEYLAAGGKVTVKLYPGAPSGFDGHPAFVKLYRDPSMETFMDCTVLVEPDGRSTYAGKTFAESDTKGLIEEMRKSCVKRGGSGWTNVTQKANVTLDLIDFLDSNFRF